MLLASRRLCRHVKGKSFAYFIGVLGVFGIVYTLVSNQRYQRYQRCPGVKVAFVGEYAAAIDGVEKDAVKQKRGRRLADLEYSKDGFNPQADDDTEDGTITKSEVYRQRNKKDTNVGQIHVPANGVLSKSEHVLGNTKRNSTTDDDLTYSFVVDPVRVRGMFKTDRHVEGASCDSFFQKNISAIIDSSIYMTRHKRKRIDNGAYQLMTKDCHAFREQRGYFETSFTKLEKDFPIAFSILAYQVMEQVERLLRAIYRPQNYYCIHLDKKASDDELKTITAIAGCLPNVFISSESLDVRWGEFSVLGAELVCLRDLWKYTDWRYFINLTGQEFPLKTNLELVKILMAMKGANLVDGTWVRAKNNYLYRWTKSGHPPPHGIRPIKGSVHVAVNRDMVNFALHDRRSQGFLVWLNHTEIPDETFFSSLNHNPHLGIPGAFLGEPEEYPRKPFFVRYKNWDVGHGIWARRCSGKYVHSICILGTGDLHRLHDDISLFANKFYLDYQYLTFECLEELIYNRAKQQYLQKIHIDTTYYELLDQVRLRLVKENG